MGEQALATQKIKNQNVFSKNPSLTIKNLSFNKTATKYLNSHIETKVMKKGGPQSVQTCQHSEN